MDNETKAKALFYYFCTERTCGGYDSCENCPKSKSHEALLEMAQWKDEQFRNEKEELLGLVEMLPLDETNQTIIEDLIALLR